MATGRAQGKRYARWIDSHRAERMAVSGELARASCDARDQGENDLADWLLGEAMRAARDRSAN